MYFTKLYFLNEEFLVSNSEQFIRHSLDDSIRRIFYNCFYINTQEAWFKKPTVGAYQDVGKNIKV